MAGVRPGRHAAVDEAHIAVAKPVKRARRQLRNTVAIVDQDNRHIGARKKRWCVELQPAVGQRHRKKGMTFDKLPRFAHI